MLAFLSLQLLLLSAVGFGQDEEDVCSLPLESGPCMAYFKVWGFNSATGQCENFVYGGCGGNGNRFDEKEECERVCI
ncbi:unnamed protein product, partial [Hydatigera taeniaeformis]|uniref:BPTI/Kunitz inhibitor domain-containing protein n=1 Tax=Hydatigena taeniaeformis TaxID=6205 RepID=A0A0R3WWN2_HYDTA